MSDPSLLRPVQRVAGTVAVGLIAGAGYLSVGPAMEFSACGGSLQCVIPIFWLVVVTAAVCVSVATVALYPTAAYDRAGVRRTTNHPVLIAASAGVSWITFAGVGLSYLLPLVERAHPGTPLWIYPASIVLGIIAVGPLAHWVVGRSRALAALGAMWGVAALYVFVSIFAYANRNSV